MLLKGACLEFKNKKKSEDDDDLDDEDDWLYEDELDEGMD